MAYPNTRNEQDYDSIPHQRLKAVIGSDWWGRRVLTWLLVILCIFGMWYTPLQGYLTWKKTPPP